MTTTRFRTWTASPTWCRGTRALAIALCLTAGAGRPAAAQTGAIVSYQLQTYQNSATLDVTSAPPFRVTTVPATAVTCNLTPTFNAATTPLTCAGTVNPGLAEWEDPVNAGKACRADVTAELLALPAGCYVSTITATDDTGQVSGRSAASNPFTRVPAPAVRTGLHRTR